MKVKTSELSGKALDWATGKAVGLNVGVTLNGSVSEIVSHNPIKISPLVPSMDWAKCGPLIEKYRIDLIARKTGDWGAMLETEITKFQVGDTPQIAICRAVVASLLGDEIELPEGLANGLD